jgi:hypothetical protein
MASGAQPNLGPMPAGNPPDPRHARQSQRTRTAPFLRLTAGAMRRATAHDGAADANEPWTLARWRRESSRILPLVAVLVLLESANWFLLDVAFGWVLPGTLLPGLAALALIIVLMGTVFSNTIFARQEMRPHQLRLRITLIGLVALQFMVNTVVGFDTARTNMPAVVAQFFGTNPVVMARIAGAVLGGSLALITFSYLLVVAAVVDRLVSPMNLLAEAMVLLRQADAASSGGKAQIKMQPKLPATPLPADIKPTIDINGMHLAKPDQGDAPTEAGTWAVGPP